MAPLSNCPTLSLPGTAYVPYLARPCVGVHRTANATFVAPPWSIGFERSAAKRHRRWRIMRRATGRGKSGPSPAEEVPVDEQTITAGVFLLLSACVAVRDEVLCKNVTFEQGVLAVALTAACAYRAGSGESRWSATVLQVCAVAGVIGFALQRAFGVPIVDGPVLGGFAPLLALASTLGLAAQTLPNLPQLPVSEKVPVWQASVVLLAVSAQSEDFRKGLGFSLGQSQDLINALGLNIGRVDGWGLALASALALITPLALVSWSRWVKGDHGSVQELLSPVLRPSLVLPIAGVNAFAEEIEFRIFLQGALLAGPAAGSYPWVAVAVLLQATYFAVLHYRIGFPSGRVGFVLVFLWALALGFLRWWVGGLGLVLLLHIQADVLIFLLVMIEELKREQQKLELQREQQKTPFQRLFGV